jgi:hypothetical protein
MQALLKRCKRLNELSLTVLGHVPLYIQELPSLKHLSIQSKYTADDIGEGVKRLTQLLPLKGLQSLCITFIIEHEDEVEDENQNTVMNANF